MNIREQLEQRELKELSPYASFSIYSKGRLEEEAPCDIRTCYQRDRDRIVHCKAFRRLKHKTQVFLTASGDHYRERLTHTMEVSQIARTIGKALYLNEDLIEAIALGHDLGHTPFGHAGERALKRISPDGFSHNVQSLRVVDHIEKEGRGLNLSWEVRDGILNHKTSGTPHTLEGKVVRFSDKFAYLHHDFDDAIRAGILSEEDIPEVFRKTLGETTKQRLNCFIHDVVNSSHGKDDVLMSPEIEENMYALRKFMFENVYTNPIAKSEEYKGEEMIEKLYTYYLEHPEKMSREYAQRAFSSDEDKSITVLDYVAGMTDQYAIEKFVEINIPGTWKH